MCPKDWQEEHDLKISALYDISNAQSQCQSAVMSFRACLMKCTGYDASCPPARDAELAVCREESGRSVLDIRDSLARMVVWY